MPEKTTQTTLCTFHDHILHICTRIYELDVRSPLNGRAPSVRFWLFHESKRPYGLARFRMVARLFVPFVPFRSGFTDTRSYSADERYATGCVLLYSGSTGRMHGPTLGEHDMPSSSGNYVTRQATRRRQAQRAARLELAKEIAAHVFIGCACLLAIGIVGVMVYAASLGMFGV